MATRKFPLFIIDSSRSHGRSRETDYVSCTSNELPWVGEITLLTDKELAIDQDWSSKNPMCLYSEPRNTGIRAKLKVVNSSVNIDSKNIAELQSLMRRCMKEWLTRRGATAVDINDITPDAIIKFADILLEQTFENLRENPADKQAKMVEGILMKIKHDYESAE